MNHRQKIRAKILYENDILTPLKRRRKALAMSKSLSKEKIEEVQALIESGATKEEIAEKAGVGLSSVYRIKSGQLTAEGKPEKPKSAPKPDVGRLHEQARAIAPAAPAAALEAAQECISPRELDALRALISQAVRAFAGIECATPPPTATT